MAIEVFPVFFVRDALLLVGETVPNHGAFKVGDVVGVLTNLAPRVEANGPNWALTIHLGVGPSARRLWMKLDAFLTADEYRESAQRPFSFGRLVQFYHSSTTECGDLNWLWLYRDTFYVTDRDPHTAEFEEVILRIKVSHFQRDEELKRLQEQVANFEAIDGQLRGGARTRKTIPDDVKLLVWSRDKAACVKCGASKELHFDHIVPLARGGSDEAVNIQLLCRTCNLAKGDRIV
jgi:5-methylcytosine-specific restriction endonuclease McrA